MNERINQLIKQSYVTAQSPSGEEYTYFSQEKFAELTVRECMEVTKTFTSNQGLDYSAPVALARHFGVEG